MMRSAILKPVSHAFLHLCLISALLLSSSNGAYADSYYPNSGVDVTDDARTIEKNHSQWILNYEWDEFNEGPSVGIPTFGYKYGLSDRFDIGIQFPYIFSLDSVNRFSGIDDFECGFKYLWTPPKEGHVWVSSIFSAKAATAPTDTFRGNGVTDYAAHLAITYESGRWTNNLNYGYNFWGNIPDVPRAATPFYRCEITYQCSPTWSLSAEVYGQRSPNEDFYGSPLQATLKTTLQVSKSFGLDIGIAKGLNGDAPVRRYLLGIAYDI
jgi:hypothetical protein